jgi:hypothetical protein
MKVWVSIFLLLLSSVNLWAEQLSPEQSQEAQQLLYRLGCLGCHNFNDSGANLAPSLDRIGLKLGEEAIFRQLAQPSENLGHGQEFMPSYQTTPLEQRRLLSRFLANRK